MNLVIDTTEQLDVDGWLAHHGVARAQGCAFANGDDGAAYHFTLWAPPGTDHQTDVDRIVEYWESLAMETRVVDHGGYPAVYATGGTSATRRFATNAAEDHYEVGANAYCAPGTRNASPVMSASPKKTLAKNISDHSKEISQKLAGEVPALHYHGDWSTDDVAVGYQLHHDERY